VTLRLQQPIVVAGAALASVLVAAALVRSPAALLALVAAAVAASVAIPRPAIALAAAPFLMALPYTWSPSVPTISGAPGVLVPLVLFVFALPRLRGFRFLRMDALVVAIAVTPALISLGQGGAIHTAQFLAPDVIAPYFGFRAFMHAAGDDVVERVVPGAIVSVGVAVALLGIIETTSGTNPATKLYGNQALLEQWGHPIMRAGLLRAQSTFGHPVAFGTFLVIPLAYALTRRRRWALPIAVLAIADALTLSRGPWLAAIVVVVLVAAAERGMWLRAGALALLSGIALFVVAPLHRLAGETLDATTAAGQAAAYREGLLVTSLRHLTLLGHPYGDLSRALANFPDVTSLIATTAISTGVVGLFELALLAAFAVHAYRRSVALASDRLLTAASVAVLGQLVALATMTFITSYQYFFWFSFAVLVWRMQLLDARSNARIS